MNDTSNGIGVRYPYEHVPSELNRFFLGKFLSAEDFECEQKFFRERSWLRNATLYGPGIVTGLEVSRNLQEKSCFKITPGLAFDQLGRELLLTQELAVHVEAESSGFLVLRFDEAAIEPVPVLAEDDLSQDREMVMNRIREAPIVEFSTDQDAKDAARNGVVLARLGFGEETPSEQFLLQTMRTYAARDPFLWPVIQNFNWQHSDVVPSQELSDVDGTNKSSPSLEITFNAEVSFTDVEASNQAGCMRLYVGGADKPQEVYVPDVHITNEGRSIACQIPAGILKKKGPQHICVSLMTASFQDKFGRVVDGCLLKGLTPSGNGVPGSVFESWFTLDLGR